MTRIIIAVVAACAAFTIVGTAGASVTAPFAPGLGTDMRWAFGREQARRHRASDEVVYVRCYVSDNSLRRCHSAGASASGPARHLGVREAGREDGLPAWLDVQPGEELHLEAEASPNCSATRGEIFGFSTLLHEAIHVQGVENENIDRVSRERRHPLGSDGLRRVEGGSQPAVESRVRPVEGHDVWTSTTASRATVSASWLAPTGRHFIA